MKSELGNQLRWNLALRNKTLCVGEAWNMVRMKGTRKWLIVQGWFSKAKTTWQEGGGGLFDTGWFCCSAKYSRFSSLIFNLHNRNVEGYPDAQRYGCVVFT